MARRRVILATPELLQGTVSQEGGLMAESGIGRSEGAGPDDGASSTAPVTGLRGTTCCCTSSWPICCHGHSGR